MTDVHYLSAILERLNNLREHISDEVDWVEAEIERLSLPAAQTPLSPALTEPTREALEDARRLIGNLLHQPVGDPRNAPSIITFEHTLPYGFVAWAQKHIAAALIHPAPAAEAPFDLEVILGSYRIGDATYEETSAAIMALFAAPAAGMREAFQARVHPWLMACFGPDISADKIERNYRFIEEALELVQACGCTQSDAHQLVDYVYGRPDGDINHEVGGVMVTLAALCLANGFDMHAAGETELVRIWGKVEAIRAKQAAKPRHSPLPGTPPSPEPAASPLGEERSHGTERQAAIADVVQYLESEGHGIPAEKVRAAFDAPVESDCEEKDR